MSVHSFVLPIATARSIETQRNTTAVTVVFLSVLRIGVILKLCTSDYLTTTLQAGTKVFRKPKLIFIRLLLFPFATSSLTEKWSQRFGAVHSDRCYRVIIKMFTFRHLLQTALDLKTGLFIPYHEAIENTFLSEERNDVQIGCKLNQALNLITVSQKIKAENADRDQRLRSLGSVTPSQPTNSGQPIPGRCLMPEVTRWKYGLLADSVGPATAGCRYKAGCRDGSMLLRCRACDSSMSLRCRVCDGWVLLRCRACSGMMSTGHCLFFERLAICLKKDITPLSDGYLLALKRQLPTVQLDADVHTRIERFGETRNNEVLRTDEGEMRGIVWHDSHLRKSRNDPVGEEASSLTAQHRGPLYTRNLYLSNLNNMASEKLEVTMNRIYELIGYLLSPWKATIGPEFYCILIIGSWIFRKVSNSTWTNCRSNPARLPPTRSGLNPRPGHSGFSQVGIVPDDAVGSEFSLGTPVSPAPSNSLIDSEDIDSKSSPNIFPLHFPCNTLTILANEELRRVELAEIGEKVDALHDERSRDLHYLKSHTGVQNVEFGRILAVEIQCRPEMQRVNSHAMAWEHTGDFKSRKICSRPPHGGPTPTLDHMSSEPADPTPRSDNTYGEPIFVSRLPEFRSPR
ncbi:hypothetical protein PR048_017627 [Dryococelus australis]|uniref:Uncharacterized protein n=1 Tax=Dryococelus australis TaxID=614101 RepID=A0ABQ9HA46_9NEOP|nr:hypothetical protein PR048_017627 [Dryococelus australis]